MDTVGCSCHGVGSSVQERINEVWDKFIIRAGFLVLEGTKKLCRMFSLRKEYRSSTYRHKVGHLWWSTLFFSYICAFFFFFLCQKLQQINTRQMHWPTNLITYQILAFFTYLYIGYFNMYLQHVPKGSRIIPVIETTLEAFQQCMHSSIFQTHTTWLHKEKFVFI